MKKEKLHETTGDSLMMLIMIAAGTVIGATAILLISGIIYGFTTLI